MRSKRLDTGFVGAQTAHNLLTSSLLAIHRRVFGSQSQVFTRIEGLSYATRIQQDLRTQNMEGSEKFKRQQRNPQANNTHMRPQVAQRRRLGVFVCLCLRFLWTTMDSVMLRPCEVANSLPIPLAAAGAPRIWESLGEPAPLDAEDPCKT